MPIAWLDQYLLGAREIPLGHCSPCCRIDLLGCCNLKIHLFALSPSLPAAGLPSNGGSFGRPLVSGAAGPRPCAATWPLRAAIRPPGRPRAAGRRGEGNQSHLTFNLSVQNQKKNLLENYIDPFLITLRHCGLLEPGRRCPCAYKGSTYPAEADRSATSPSPALLSHLGRTQSYASLAKGVFLN